MANKAELVPVPRRFSRRAVIIGGAATVGAAIGGFLISQDRQQTPAVAAKPTAHPDVTTPPTAAPRPTDTPAPTDAPSMNPSHETTHPSGLVERYDMVTEKNFGSFFEGISPDEFQKLVQGQPDLPAFPFTPLSEKFSMGETITTGGTRSPAVYSPDLLISSGIEGTLTIVKNGNDVVGIDITKITGKTTDIFSLRAYGTSPNIEVKKGTESTVKKGESIGEFLGSGPFNPGRYSAEPNQITIDFMSLEKLDQPTVTVSPDGTKRTFVNKVTHPALGFDANNWVHTKTNKIAYIKP